ncbi:MULTISPECIES: SH3 domain-containing protein [Aestuariibaculum]|uniref:Tetratricopeptide repeat protein n=1 Tax=Aestuariibaculum lutulentum TaxID=2920935 RepID=A0ABS9RJN0_9FLAO|nr:MULTISPECIES: tetratricopeptide repeat protein [Aestuariibaculum]MCH4552312.1 tetratricopeptide repeat protein [Aestuariibaculum lutulentum]MCR8667388.1 tetratricopeptide repeat protein [Aestuariibaculum sp. M13]
MKRLLFTLLVLVSFGVFAQNQTLFEKANALYNDGKYAEAIDKYEAILATKNESAELYFNLGNANYKLNNIAPSIYYFEKALQLAPNDADIKNNLSFARNMTIDAIDVLPEGGIAKFVKKLTNTMSFDGWAKLAVAFVFSFVVLFLAYYFAYSTIRKRMAFIGSLAALVLICVSLSLAFHKYNLDKRDRPAIVFVQESKVKSEPNNRSEEAFRLHEGTKVQILDTVEDWKKIKLADGKSGWIAKQDIKAL